MDYLENAAAYHIVLAFSGVALQCSASSLDRFLAAGTWFLRWGLHRMSRVEVAGLAASGVILPTSVTS